MEFTIYTFGDVEVFRAALTAVKAVFSSDLFTSASGLGLGSLVVLALLVGLTTILLGGVIQQKVDIGMFFIMIMVFFMMFVPKFPVNIEDHSGAAVAKVDDVPLGIALPAGLVSGIAHDLNEKMGTAFTTVQSNAGPLNSPEALTSPLKLLFSLRNAATITLDKQPRIASNMANLVAYCLAGRETNYTDWRNMPLAGKASGSNALSLGPVAEMLARAQTASGLTMYQATPTGEMALATCEVAASGIMSNLNDLLAAPASPGASSTGAALNLELLLTAAAAKDGAATVSFENSKAIVVPVGLQDQTRTLMNLFDASANGAESFVTNAIFGVYIDNAFLCSNDTGNPSEWAKCLPFLQATHQWAEDEAAGGALFQRIMFHGMNAMFFIWICLAPVVAVVMLMKGVRGLPLAGSYVLFGAWTVSWYVGASIVNFYMLKQMQYELTMLGGIDQLTQATFWSFFDVMQSKIAIAGSMLASVPLITMTVMSGSMYGMVQMAQRFGGSDRYDEKANTPDVIQSAALSTRQAKSNTQFGGATTDRRYAAGPSFSVSDANEWSEQETAQSQLARSRKLGSTITNSFKELFANKTLGTKDISWLKDHGITDIKGFQGALKNDTAGEIVVQDGKSTSDSTIDTIGLGGRIKFGFDYSAGKSAVTKAASPGKGPVTVGDGKDAVTTDSLNTGVGVDLHGSKDRVQKDGVESSTKGSNKTGMAAGTTDTTGVQASDGQKFSILQGLARQIAHDYGNELGEAKTNELTEASSYTESAGKTSMRKHMHGGSLDMDAEKMRNAIYATGANADLTVLNNDMRMDPVHGQAYMNNYDRNYRAYQLHFAPGDAAHLATLRIPAERDR